MRKPPNPTTKESDLAGRQIRLLRHRIWLFRAIYCGVASRIRLLQGSGLSNTTWFGGLLARQGQKSGSFGQKEPAFLAKAGFLVTLVPGIPDPGIPESGIPGWCTFGVPLLLYGSQKKPAKAGESRLL